MADCDSLPRTKRYPEVVQCTWRGQGKCVNVEFRYTLLQERLHVTSWHTDDLLELVDALPSTCTLDLADHGGMRLEEVALVIAAAEASCGTVRDCGVTEVGEMSRAAQNSVGRTLERAIDAAFVPKSSKLR